MAKNAKCHSSQPRAGQYIAGIACRNTGNPGSNFKNLLIFLIFLPCPPLLTSCAVDDELIHINSPLCRRVSGIRPGNNSAKPGKSGTWYRSLQFVSGSIFKSVDKIRQRHVSLLRIVSRRFPAMVIAAEIIADDAVLQLKPQLLQHE